MTNLNLLVTVPPHCPHHVKQPQLQQPRPSITSIHTSFTCEVPVCIHSHASFQLPYTPSLYRGIVSIPFASLLYCHRIVFSAYSATTYTPFTPATFFALGSPCLHNRLLSAYNPYLLCTAHGPLVATSGLPFPLPLHELTTLSRSFSSQP